MITIEVDGKCYLLIIMTIIEKHYFFLQETIDIFITEENLVKLLLFNTSMTLSLTSINHHYCHYHKKE